MASIQAVAVYCSSSPSVPSIYLETAAALGAALAGRKWTLVYGGNYVGSMAAVADGARRQKGRVVGITPRLFHEKGLSDLRADELILTDTMRQRKQLLEDHADAFIALPGGLGTYEELFEVIVGKQLKYHTKPIVLLDVNDYYAPLLAMIRHGMSQEFIKLAAEHLWYVAATVEQAIAHLETYQPPHVEPITQATRPPSSIE